MEALAPFIAILVIIVIGGAIVWLLDQAPIDGQIKQWGKWLMYVVIVVLVILQLADFIPG